MKADPRPFFPILLALSLTACAAAGPGGGSSSAAQSAERAATESAPKPAAPEVAALPPLPLIDPAEVLKFSRDELIAAFGPPAFKRTDKGAEMLRFSGADCVLDVFLYPDDSGPAGPDGKPSLGPARIHHLEARDIKGRPADRHDCLNKTPRKRG